MTFHIPYDEYQASWLLSPRPEELLEPISFCARNGHTEVVRLLVKPEHAQVRRRRCVALGTCWMTCA